MSESSKKASRTERIGPPLCVLHVKYGGGALAYPLLCLVCPAHDNKGGRCSLSGFEPNGLSTRTSDFERAHAAQIELPLLG